MNAIEEKAPRLPIPLSAVELAELRQRLESERQRLAALYLDDVRRERAVDFSEAEDDVDRSDKSSVREEESALADFERDQLRLVEEALERMRDGSYGRCLRTGEPIVLERLRAMPWARYGREVQEDVEEGVIEETAPSAGESRR